MQWKENTFVSGSSRRDMAHPQWGFGLWFSIKRKLTWRREWILSRPAREYFLLQSRYWHTKGFKPVWMSSWACKCPLVMNCISHCSHLKGLSPVCVRICVFKLPVSRNSLRQRSNGQISSLISVFGRFTFLISGQCSNEKVSPETLGWWATAEICLMAKSYLRVSWTRFFNRLLSDYFAWFKFYYKWLSCMSYLREHYLDTTSSCHSKKPKLYYDSRCKEVDLQSSLCESLGQVQMPRCIL